MTLKDFQELTELRNNANQKWNKVNELFPDGVSAISQEGILPEQQEIITDFNEAWEKLRQKLQELGGYVD